MRILFVCSGNTCRSPMAAAICRARHPDWAVSSAGTWVGIAAPASAYASEAAKAYGGDLGGHMSRQVTAAMLEEADAIVPMTSGHMRFIVQNFPGCEPKVRFISEISDPFGGDYEEYARCAKQISKLVDAL